MRKIGFRGDFFLMRRGRRWLSNFPSRTCLSSPKECRLPFPFFFRLQLELNLLFFPRNIVLLTVFPPFFSFRSFHRRSVLPAILLARHRGALPSSFLPRSLRCRIFSQISWRPPSFRPPKWPSQGSSTVACKLIPVFPAMPFPPPGYDIGITEGSLHGIRCPPPTMKRDRQASELLPPSPFRSKFCRALPTLLSFSLLSIVTIGNFFVRPPPSSTP